MRNNVLGLTPSSAAAWAIRTNRFRSDGFASSALTPAVARLNQFSPSRLT